MASLIEILQRENSRLQSTSQEIQGLAKRAQAKRLEGERIRNNRVNINTPTTGQEDFNLNPSSASPGGKPISQPSQQSSPPPQSAPQGGSQSAPSSGPPQAVNNKAVLTGSQYKEAISISGARSPEAKLALSENIASPEVRDAVQTALQVDLAKEKEKQGLASFEKQKVGSTGLRGGKVDLASNIFENSSFAINARRTAKLQKAIDDDFLSKQRDDQQLRQLSIEKSQLELKQLRQQGKSDFGSPAQQAIVQTADGTFTNLAGAVGSEVTPAQPAILPQGERIAQDANKAKVNAESIKGINSNKPTPLSKVSQGKKGTKAQLEKTRIDNEFDSLRKDPANEGVDDQALRNKAIKTVRLLSRTVLNRRERETSKVLQSMRETGQAVRIQKSSLDLQASILSNPNFDVSSIGGVKNDIGKYLTAFGIPTKGFGLNDPTQNAIFTRETFNALMETLKTQKGVQTEGDADRARQTFATLNTQTKEGAQFIVNYMRSVAVRNIMRDNFFTDAIAKGGGALSSSELAQVQSNFNDTLRDTPVFVNISQPDGSNKALTFSGYRDKLVNAAKKAKISVDESAILSGWQKLFANNPS